jgi:hypothetical protein
VRDARRGEGVNLILSHFVTLLESSRGAMKSAVKAWLVDSLSRIPSLRGQRIARFLTAPLWWWLRHE